MQIYQDGREQLREDGEIALLDRRFRLLLLGTGATVKYEAEDETIEDVLDHDENRKSGDVALRIQVIGNPTQPFGARDRLVQFFVVEGNRDAVRNALGPSVIYRQDESGDQIPIAFLNRGDTERTISGEGATISLPYAEDEPEAAPRVLATAAGTSETDKDGNSVPDAQEYVDGDPDKGVLTAPTTETVRVVSDAPQEAKPGTVSEENRKALEAEDKPKRRGRKGRK